MLCGSEGHDTCSTPAFPCLVRLPVSMSVVSRGSQGSRPLHCCPCDRSPAGPFLRPGRARLPHGGPEAGPKHGRGDWGYARWTWLGSSGAIATVHAVPNTATTVDAPDGAPDGAPNGAPDGAATGPQAWCWPRCGRVAAVHGMGAPARHSIPPQHAPTAHPAAHTTTPSAFRTGPLHTPQYTQSTAPAFSTVSHVPPNGPCSPLRSKPPANATRFGQPSIVSSLCRCGCDRSVSPAGPAIGAASAIVTASITTGTIPLPCLSPATPTRRANADL